MATSSARRIVLFSSSPVASIRISVEVEGCITAAPSLGLGSIFDPSVYTHSSGVQRGTQAMGSGGSSGSGGGEGVLSVGRWDRSGGGWVSGRGGAGSKAPGANCAIVRGSGGGRGVGFTGQCSCGVGCVISCKSQESRFASMH